MSNRVRIILILVLMAAVIGISYWYMKETTGQIEKKAEKKWRLHDHLYSVSFNQGGKQGWAVGKHGTIICSSDEGETWSYQQSGVSEDLLSVYVVSEDTVLAVGRLGLILRTTDAGKTWEKMNIGKNYLLNDVFFTDERSGWIVGEFESIYQTTDGGKQWDLVHGGEQKEMDFSDVEEGELVGADFGVEEEVYTLNSIYFYKKNYAWCVGEYGTILISSDGGRNWNKVRDATDMTLCDVEFFDESFGFAVGLDGTILKSTDGGKTWEKEKPSIVAHYYGVSFKRFGSEIERKDAVAVGQGIIAQYSFHKKPYLQNWVPALEMNYKIDYHWMYDVEFISQTGERVVAVGHEGLVLMSTTGGSEWDIVRYPEKAVEQVLNP